MDKELLEKILKSGITVQGDLVMEKHVENEIGNVEAGGIGIQIVHGSGKIRRASLMPMPTRSPCSTLPRLSNYGRKQSKPDGWTQNDSLLTVWAQRLQRLCLQM